MPDTKVLKVRNIRDTSCSFRETTKRISYEEHNYHPQGLLDRFYTYDVRCLDATLSKTLSYDSVLDTASDTIFIKLQYREYDSIIYDYLTSSNYIRCFDADDETAEAVYNQIIYDMPDWDVKFVEYLGFEKEKYDE